MKTKTINVMVMVQMDVNPERVLADVVTGLDSMNGLLQKPRRLLQCSNIHKWYFSSDITNVTPEFEMGIRLKYLTR